MIQARRVCDTKNRLHILIIAAIILGLLSGCWQPDMEAKPPEQSKHLESLVVEESESSVQEPGTEEEDSQPTHITRLYKDGEILLEADEMKFAINGDGIFICNNGQWEFCSLHSNVFHTVDVDSPLHYWESMTKFTRGIPIRTLCNQIGVTYDRYNSRSVFNVSKDGKWQFIDEQLQPIIDQWFDLPTGEMAYLLTYYQFYKDTAIIKDGDTAILIDINGNILRTFEHVRSVTRPAMSVVSHVEDVNKETPDLSQYFDLQGNYTNYNSAVYYTKISFQDGRSIILNEEGEQVLEYDGTEPYAAHSFFSFLKNGNFIAQIDAGDSEAKAYQFFNSNGEPISETFSDVSFTQLDAILVQKQNNMFAFVDTYGQPLFGQEYVEASPFYDGIALVRQTEQSGYQYIDMTGKAITDTAFVYAKPFLNGIGIVQDENGKYAIIDSDGIFKTDYLYDDIDYFYSDLAVITVHEPDPSDQRNFCGLLDKDGNEVVAPNERFQYLYPLKDDFFLAVVDFYPNYDYAVKYNPLGENQVLTSTIIDSNGKVLFADEPGVITYHGDGMFYIDHADKRIEDKEGNLVFDLVGSDLADYHNGYFIIRESVNEE